GTCSPCADWATSSCPSRRTASPARNKKRGAGAPRELRSSSIKQRRTVGGWITPQKCEFWRGKAKTNSSRKERRAKKSALQKELSGLGYNPKQIAVSGGAKICGTYSRRVNWRSGPILNA